MSYDKDYNISRNRHYGLRIGDTVSCDFIVYNKGEVVHFYPMDNNRVDIRLDNDTIVSYPAEWCKIIKEK